MDNVAICFNFLYMRLKFSLVECFIISIVIAAINFIVFQFIALENGGRFYHFQYEESSHAARIFDLNLKLDLARLPTFAVDNSEYVIASLIEKDWESPNNAIYFISTFLVCHQLLSLNQIQRYFRRANRSNANILRWKKAYHFFKQTSYSLSGNRIADKYNSTLFCKISLDFEIKKKTPHNLSMPLIVEGEFVPNRLTADSNANRRLDILRCQIPASYNVLMDQQKEGNLVVELFRRPNVESDMSIIRFAISFGSGSAGLFVTKAFSSEVSSPPHLPVNNDSSYFSPFISSSRFHSSIALPVVHLCIPAIKRTLSRETLPALLEFLSHHLSIGIKHIYLPSPHSSRSVSTQRILKLLHSYIETGQVSLIPQSSEDSDDMKLTFAGIQWDLLLVKVLQSNACLYMAKEKADYLLILDVDEFLIPNSVSGNLPSIIAKADPYFGGSVLSSNRDYRISRQAMSSWKVGPGYADKDGHPLCYITLRSAVLLQSTMENGLPGQARWISSRFPHSPEINTSLSGQVASSAYERVLLPTRHIFYTGLNSPGACRLEAGWNGCSKVGSSFCRRIRTGDPRRLEVASNGEGVVNFRRDHCFDEMVTPADAKQLPEMEAIVYHYQLYSRDLKASKEAMRGVNDYTLHYSEAALKDIRRRGLDAVVELPLESYQESEALETELLPLFTVDEIRKISTVKNAPAARTEMAVVDPLPTAANYNRSDSSIVTLPNFARDYSEFLTAAVNSLQVSKSLRI